MPANEIGMDGMFQKEGALHVLQLHKAHQVANVR